MTLFEKIYWTCFVISFVLYLVGWFLYCNDYDEILWLIDPFSFQIVLTVGYGIVKLILWFWGIHIDLFPSIG